MKEGQADDPWLPYQPRPRRNTGPFEELSGFQTPLVNWTVNGPSGGPFSRGWPGSQDLLGRLEASANLQILDLSHDCREIGTRESDFWRRNTVPLDVWGNMPMMGKCCSQIWLVWVGKVIIPIQPFGASIDLVPVGRDQAGVKVKLFSQAQPNAVGEKHLSFGNAGVTTCRPDGYRRALHRRTVQ